MECSSKTVKFTHLSLHNPKLFRCNWFYSQLLFYTFQCDYKGIPFDIAFLLLLLLFFVCFTAYIAIASSGHTSATLVNNRSLEVQIWDILMVNCLFREDTGTKNVMTGWGKSSRQILEKKKGKSCLNHISIIGGGKKII